MTIRIVRLGSDRASGEGLRIGTVRRPPRGIPKEHHASGNWYDVWLPQLTPSAEAAQRRACGNDDTKGWQAFVRKYRSEMAGRDHARLLALLAARSRTTNFSVGCYCEDDTHYHRSVLRELLVENGADVA